MPPRSSAARRRSLGYFVSVTDNGAHEDAARELFIVSANLFYHERKRFLSRAQTFFIVSAKVYARDEKGGRPNMDAQKINIKN